MTGHYSILNLSIKRRWWGGYAT